MRKYLVIFSIFVLNIFANPSIIQKQNVLYVQNLIDKEEAIAEAFEKYILNEFKIPTIENLIDDRYLGKNFSLDNMMGEKLKTDYIVDKKLEYAVTNSSYINASNSYVKDLYNRDLYRDRTYVVLKEEVVEESGNKYIDYINIELKSEEAKNIYAILKSLKIDESFKKDCKNVSSGFCSSDVFLRYYFSASQYIEFTKKEYLNGNVSLSSISLLKELVDDGKFKDLRVGAYIFVEDLTIYIKYSKDKGILVK